MNINQVINGFEIKDIKEVKEASGTFYEMVHIKTKAKLGWFKTEDDNKTFSITFKTLPSDDTGVFHILEHSVLQGSKNYPIKAPFVELIKGSMNTFLNAMTYPDKTVYPVSSKNDKDFENLTRVYLDSVFNPMLYENEKIFLQEGWHYEFDEEGNPSYNGVVLNEMRGATSSVDSIMYHEMQKLLFPNNCYKYNSGGDPNKITTLTYEAFKNSHKKFYHPSNSIILLDGNLDIEKILGIIDNEYLSHYSEEFIDFDISFEDPRGYVSDEKYYAVDNLEENQGYLSLGYVISTFKDKKDLFALKLLTRYLAANNDSPLPKAIIESGLGYDVAVQTVDGILQPYVMVTARNIELENADKIERMLWDTIEDVRRKGLDKEQLSALLCALEFSARERDYGGEPAGLINCLTMLDTWLYNGEPTLNLSVIDTINELKEEVSNGTFEQYLDKFFLKNEHVAKLIMKPSTTFLDEQRNIEKEKVEKEVNSYSESQREELKIKEIDLKEWQAVPNTEEECECLPCLNLSDISEDVDKAIIDVLDDGTLFHSAKTKGIKYLTIYIPVKDVSLEKMATISLLTGLYGKLPLVDLDKIKLDIKRRMTFGGFEVFSEVESKVSVKDSLDIYVGISASYLKEKEEEALKLLSDIIHKTDFKAENITDLLKQEQEDLKQEMIMAGHSVAMMSAREKVSLKGKYLSANDGPYYGKYIDKAVKEITEDSEKFCNRLKSLSNSLFYSKDFLVSLTSDDEKEEMRDKINSIFKFDEFNEVDTLEYSEDIELSGSFIQIPAPISFSALACNMNDFDIKNSGSWLVFSKLATMDYLWNKVRVQGGAYGVRMAASVDGIIGFYSYRDPSPKESINVYKGVPEYIREFCKNNPDLTRIIIGTVSDIEHLTTPSTVGKMADLWYLTGVTDELRKERRKEVINTNISDLLRIADDLEKVLEKNSTCIVSNVE